ncbi:Anaerobic ribonucleoside-triphosphate reductase-activating protein [Gammaproteobacteria bacterium]
MTIKTLQLAAYLPRSRANGPGLRSVVWTQGCPFNCSGCFNPDFLSFSGGRIVSVSEIVDWILTEEDTEGVSFSGGEPFSQASALAEVAERVHDAGKGVLIFTGFTSEALYKNTRIDIQRLLATTDLLVAGPYQRDKPCRHSLLASTNQELIFLTQRYRTLDLGHRRMEFCISVAGEVTVTGFPMLSS